MGLYISSYNFARNFRFKDILIKTRRLHLRYCGNPISVEIFFNNLKKDGLSFIASRIKPATLSKPLTITRWSHHYTFETFIVTSFTEKLVSIVERTSIRRQYCKHQTVFNYVESTMSIVLKIFHRYSIPCHGVTSNICGAICVSV